jgi:alginate O-acetyltransferase complex protein AlgI
MVFSSAIFLFYFLPGALAVYYSLKWTRQQTLNLSLAILGYLFYGWSNPLFIPLMLGTTTVDWLASLIIAHDDWRAWTFRHRPVSMLVVDTPRSRLQHRVIAVSIVSNLAVLGFFKYFNFGIDNYNAVVSAIGFDRAVWEGALRVVLPLGISFYTFQSLSYTIDVYRGQALALEHFIDFSCFVSMFPHLVAGPILQFSFLSRQLTFRTLTVEKFGRGVSLFAFGMGKKVLLANPCGKVAETVFNAGSAHAIDAWYGIVAYAFQIYFDFSGYSDMAIGLGLMLGFIFAKNFDSPYRSRSITDFWRRWHISLSSWLRDYLYIPLGGSRKGSVRTYVNLFVTMLLGGLWHGASWNFLIWGGLHGGCLAAERMLDIPPPRSTVSRVLRMASTFVIVLVGWVFFRAATLPAAVGYLRTMAGLTVPAPSAELIRGLIYKPYYLLTVVLAAIVVWGCPQAWDFTRRLSWPRACASVAVLWLAIVMLFTQSYNPFIYFIF